MNDLKNKKKKFRKKQFILRRKLYFSVKQVFNISLFEELFEMLNFESFNIVSSFISINTEINTSELNNYIVKKNKILCLPSIIKKDSHLIFRKFISEEDMIDGFMKIKEPSIKNEILDPEIIFVPCLAYDELGFRLGYGGGYYDKTFYNLKKNKKNFISIGYAFDDQKVAVLPKDNFDIKLDYVITEKKIYPFL
tara:strand:+ start:3213 stop:3794 length:582 start_codon:yes stop_codon:yes gene_type:complete